MRFPKLRWIVLTAALLFYGFLYVATTKVLPLSDFCEKSIQVNEMLRRDYIFSATCCSDSSFCVYVKDTTGVDWSLLADTACMYLQLYDQNQHNTFVIRNTSTGLDTLASRHCP